MGRRVAKLPLLFDPGAKYAYSVAVDVQALLTQKLAGQPFAEYVRQNVFQPLGMKNTAWRLPDNRLPRYATVYQRNKQGGLEPQPEAMRRQNFHDNRLTLGGHGLGGSIDDYMRFARMLLEKGELEGARVLQPSTV